MIGASRASFSALSFSSRSANSGRTVCSEQLEALHDVLVAVPAGLADEHHLVDAELLVATQVLADLLGGADRAPQAAHPRLDRRRRRGAGVGGGRRTTSGSNPCSGPPFLELGHTSVTPGWCSPNR